MFYLNIILQALLDSGAWSLALLVITGLSIVVAFILAGLQAFGRRVPAFVWFLGPLAIMIVGFLGTQSGFSANEAALTVAAPDTKSTVLFAGQSIAISFEFIALLFTAITSVFTAVFAAWGIVKPPPTLDSEEANARRTTGAVTLVALTGLTIAAGCFARAVMGTALTLSGLVTATQETKAEVMAFGTQLYDESILFGQITTVAVCIALGVFIAIGRQHTLKARSLVSGGLIFVLVGLGALSVQQNLSVTTATLTQQAQTYMYRGPFETVNIPTVAQAAKNVWADNKNVTLFFRVEKNGGEVTLEGTPMDQGPLTNGIYPGLTASLTTAWKKSRDITEAFSDVPGILDGDDEIWFAAQRDATWSDIKPVLNTLAAQKWKTTVLFAVRGPESDTFVRGYLPTATAETEPSEGDEATEPTEGDDAGEPATDEASPAAPATDLFVGKNSWKRVVTRAGAEPETQTFDTLAALQTARKASPAPTEFSQLHLEDDVTVQALIDTLLVFNDGDEAWPRTVVLTVE